MAIYHLEAKVISRGVGRSAVAASAYMSCSHIYNDYDGIQHDYTRKQGLVYEQVLLPPQAPPEWTDRSILWNAVEETEKTKDSRLAREFVVALPMELSKEENISLLTEYVQKNFVNDGMCADFCIHDTDGHNPHAHIILTVRPLDENGKWQNKTEKEYLCIKNGEERGFTSSEFKTAQADGWEKQYQYIVGKKKVYMPPSQAELHGYERASKYPKSTCYGRQNPIAERWNSEEQLQIWRKNWADINNLYLERKNIDERIDHRSHKERGIDEQPTIHEGVTARIIEQKGGTSERCEINRQIKADNKLLRELKKQYAKLVEVVKHTVASVSKVFETLRKNMICYRYNIEATSFWKFAKQVEVSALKSKSDKHLELYTEIKEKVAERKKLKAELDKIPKLQIFKRSELMGKINTLSEQIEDLKSEKSMLLKELGCADDRDISKINSRIYDITDALAKIERHTDNCKVGIKNALQEFDELYMQTADMDNMELIEERLRIRPQAEQEAETELKTAYKDNFSRDTFKDSIRITDNDLHEDLYAERSSIIRKLRAYKQQQQEQTYPKPKQQSHDNEEWEL